MIPTTGRNHIADQLLAVPAQTSIGWMAVGTGSTAEDISDTQLGTEKARVALDSKVRNGNVVTYTATFPDGTPAGSNALTEVGLFNNATAGLGDMLSRIVHGVKTKDVGESVTIVHKITISQ